jgi:hypothetical protein
MCVVLSVAAGPVWAQTTCPTAADLTKGIRIGFPDGSTEIYRQGQAGVIRVQGSAGDGTAYEMDLGQGIHLLSYVDVEQGRPIEPSRITYDFGMPAANLPVPEPERGASLVGARTDGAGTLDQRQKLAFGPIEPLVIGGCSYQSLQVLISYESEDSYAENVIYIPELGISYLYWNRADDVEPVPIAAESIAVMSK